MRSACLAAALLLAACTTATAVSPGGAAGNICSTEGTDQFLGQQGNSESGAAIMHATHAAVLRWAPPGYMLTMDFSPSRVTVRLGPRGEITAINCG
ncbi:MAG: I78 family peptidase inhibitor [Sphingomicrobium sp.]